MGKVGFCSLVLGWDTPFERVGEKLRTMYSFVNRTASGSLSLYL